MKHTKNIAFTLVELIVVITILAVLATVAFISFQGYTSSSRDSVRLADLKNISKSFEFMKTKGQELPLPDQKVDITASGTIFQYQGVLEEQTLKLSNIHNGGLDPLTGKPYGYAVNAQRNKFQVIGFLENSQTAGNNLLSQSLADNSDKFVKTSGDALGILLDESTNELIVDENNTLVVDVANTSTNYIIGVENKKLDLQSGGLGAIIKNSSCKALKQNNPSLASGEYTIFPDGKNGLTVFCDMETTSEAWTGLYYKNAAQSCNNFGNNYTLTQVQNLNFDDFAVSDSLSGVGVDQSWIIRDIDFSDDTEFYEKFRNISNCTTPTTTAWSQSYEDGYLFFRGTLDTFGEWQEMNTGCTGTTWNIGQTAWLRVGGGNAGHTGEFIHSSCNGYNYENNSVTSRWNDNNTRMFWVK